MVGKSTLANGLVLSYTGATVAPFESGFSLGQGTTIALNQRKARANACFTHRSRNEHAPSTPLMYSRALLDYEL